MSVLAIPALTSAELCNAVKNSYFKICNQTCKIFIIFVIMAGGQLLMNVFFYPEEIYTEFQLLLGNRFL